MNIIKVGDTGKAICEHCKRLCSVTYKLHDVPLSDDSAVVKKVLVGVCDQCDSVAVLPQQSVPVVKAQLERQRQPIETRLPAHMVDILNVVSDKLGGSTDYVPTIVKFYIHTLSQREMSPAGLQHYLKSDLASGKADKRLSLKGRYVSEEIEELKKIADIHSTTDIVKSVVLKINDDILVQKKEKPTKQLQSIIAANC